MSRDGKKFSGISSARCAGRRAEAFGATLPALVITGNANVAAVRERLPGLPIAVKPVPPGKLRAFLSQALATA